MNVIVTCEIDKTREVVPFASFEAEIWVTRQYIATEDEADTFWVDGFGGNLDDVSNTKTSITSFISGSTIYAKMLSLDDLRTIDQNGFYWDNDNQDLYVKFYNQQPWYIQRSIRAGETLTYINKAQNDSTGRPTNTIIGGLIYSPRVKIGSISSGRVEDNLRDNKMVFNDFSFDIYNTDGDLDNIREDVINLGARIKKAEVPNGQLVTIEDLKVMRSGFINNVSFPDDNTARFSCGDPREILDSKIVTNKLTQSEFADLKDNLVDKNKPIAVGNLTGIPTVRLEDTNLVPVTPPWTTNDTIDFMIGDTAYGSLTSVSNVYLEGSIYKRNTSEGRWDREAYDLDTPLVDTSPSAPTTTGEYSLDLSTGIVTIWGYAGGKVHVDCIGSKPLGTATMNNHILWFLDTFAGISYIESFFFLEESNIVLDRSSSYTGGMYVGTNGSKLKNIIDILAGSINLRIVEKEDRFTFVDLFVPTDISDMKIIEKEEVKYPVSRDYDTDRYMSSILIKYNKDWSEADKYTTYLDDSKESDAITANSKQKTYEFETVVNSEAQAQVLADERYTITPPLHVDLDIVNTLDFELYEYIIFRVSRRNDKQIVSNAMYRVVEINELSRTARLRWIKSVTLSDASIPVIIDTEYQQGYLYNEKLYEHKLYSITQGVN